MIETPSTYIPMDRRQALLHGQSVPEYTRGAALFADVSGFTALTEALVDELGPQRGAEELTHHLNQVYDALIGELHRYGGSVLVFSGDAITCWLDGDVGLRATACALAMQAAMQQFQGVMIPSGATVSLAVKVAVATGSVRRVLVGDPAIQIMDAMAGSTLDRMVAAEHHANKGEVVLGPYALASVARHAHIAGYRRGTAPGARYGVVADLRREVPPRPWQPIPPEALPVDEVRAWLLPQIYQRLSSGQGEFMAELRPAVALFLRFSGMEYDVDREAGEKLDTFVSQVQRIFARYDGAVLQLTIGDKGNYLYAVLRRADHARGQRDARRLGGGGFARGAALDALYSRCPDWHRPRAHAHGRVWRDGAAHLWRNWRRRELGRAPDADRRAQSNSGQQARVGGGGARLY